MDTQTVASYHHPTPRQPVEKTFNEEIPPSKVEDIPLPNDDGKKYENEKPKEESFSGTENPVTKTEERPLDEKNVHSVIPEVEGVENAPASSDIPLEVDKKDADISSLEPEPEASSTLEAAGEAVKTETCDRPISEAVENYSEDKLTSEASKEIAAQKLGAEAFKKVAEEKPEVEAVYILSKEKQGAENVQEQKQAVEYVLEEEPRAENVREENLTVKYLQEEKTGSENVQEEKLPVKYVPEEKSAMEDVIEQKPAVEDVLEQEPVVEGKLEQKPAVVDAQEDKSAVKDLREEKQTVHNILEEKPTVEDVQEEKLPIKDVEALKPAVEGVQQEKPTVEDVQEEKPEVKDVQELKPTVENIEVEKSVQNVQEEKSIVLEDVQGKKPTVKDVQELKPTVENIEEEKPAVQNVHEKKSIVLEDGQEENPAIKDVQALKPTVENTPEEKPALKDVQAENPAVENLQKDKPAAEDVLEEKTVVEDVPEEKPAVENVQKQAIEPVQEKLEGKSEIDKVEPISSIESVDKPMEHLEVSSPHVSAPEETKQSEEVSAIRSKAVEIAPLAVRVEDEPQTQSNVIVQKVAEVLEDEEIAKPADSEGSVPMKEEKISESQEPTAVKSALPTTEEPHTDIKEVGKDSPLSSIENVVNEVKIRDVAQGLLEETKKTEEKVAEIKEEYIRTEKDSEEKNEKIEEPIQSERIKDDETNVCGNVTEEEQICGDVKVVKEKEENREDNLQTSVETNNGEDLVEKVNQKTSNTSTATGPIESLKDSQLDDEEEETKKAYANLESTKETVDETKSDPPPKEGDETKTSRDVPTQGVSVKPAHKSSGNIMSKVKQSIVKVKKAIIGKSPSSKTMQAEAKGGEKIH